LSPEAIAINIRCDSDTNRPAGLPPRRILFNLIIGRKSDYRVVTSGIEIGAGWQRTSRDSGASYVSLSLAAPEFGPRKLYANLGRAAGQDDDNVFAVIWNPAD